MKSKYMLILSISVIIISSFYFGCNKNNNNPVGSDNFTGIAQDYFPPTPNKQISVNVSGAVTHYDSLGRITALQQITNQKYGCSFGEATIFRNLNAIPFFLVDAHGNSRLAGYYANNNGYIVTMGNSPSGNIFTILPKQLKINDEWIVTPPSGTNSTIHFKLAGGLDHYTNSAGKSYSNIINILITFNDSTSNYYYYGGSDYYTSYTRRTFSVNLYLAKSVGVIDAIINNNEVIVKWSSYYSGQYHSHYEKIVIDGSVGVL